MKDHTNKLENKRVLKRAAVLIAAIVTAIAVFVACALFTDFSPAVDVDDVQSGEVSQSTSFSNKTGNLTGAGVISNGDVLNYTYTGTVVNVTLPKGIYDITMYGAQGGNAEGYTGGKGGVSRGRYEITASSQTLYIVVGGAGGTTRNNTSYFAPGGYNGGGRGYPSGGNTSHTQTSGGGGGATHIATVSRGNGLLTAYASYKTDLLMVAGGGGGAGAWYGDSLERSNGGAGGGTSGGAATNGRGNSAAGGTQSTGYQFGQGGSGVHADQGGGGGGYWGGRAQTGTSDIYISGGGGGSGYVNTSKLTNSSTAQQSSVSGNGSVAITVVNVNKAPVTRSLVKSVGLRGSANVVINASEIASDPEGTNVYFTDGNTSNLDTFTLEANKRLYVDSSCSTLATNYFDWQWVNNTQLKITNVKRYPRSGINGSTANGRITLYVRMRDNYGNNIQRGTAVIPFTVTVTPPTPTQRATTNPVEISAGVGEGYSYFIGNSNTTVPPETNATANTLYNPSGTGRYTLILSNSLRKNTTFTVRAADLLASVYGGDTVAIALNSTTAITGNSKKYRIVEYDNNTNKIAAYNANRVAIANAFSQISFECLDPEPGYQVFSVTLYLLENNTAYGTQYVVPGSSSVNLDIVFKMDNTRPVLKDTSSVEPTVTVNTLQSETIDINDFFRDADTQKITPATHQIREIKVATREFVQLDKYGKILSTANASGDNKNKSYFNVVPTSAAISPSAALADSLTTGMFAGSDFATGFEEWYISSGANNRAFVQYSYNNNNNNKLTITFTGLRATYDMYASGRNGKRIATSGDSSDIKFNEGGVSGALNAGHFYVLVNILDKNDTSDDGIWLPIGIKVNNVAPTDMSQERGGTGASIMPTASGNPGDVFYFTPMGITVERVTYPIGARRDEAGNFISRDIRPIAADADNFFETNMLNGASVGGGGDIGVLNELVAVTSSPADVRASVSNNNTGTFFDVAEEPIYIPYEYFGGRVKYDGTPVTFDGKQYVAVRGLKITLNNWTHNRYLYAAVNIADSAGAIGQVRIAVNVNNAAPQSFTREDNKVALLDYEANGMKVSSEYTPAGENTVATITYNIPMHSTVIVTPYDLLTDENMTAGYPAGGFTLNGLSGLFNENDGIFTVNAKKSDGDTRKVINGLGNHYNTVKGGIDYSSADNYVSNLKSTLTELQNKRDFTSALSSGNLFSSGAETVKSTYIDRLFFERNSDGRELDGYTFNPYASTSTAMDFVTPVMGEGFVKCAFGNALKFDGDGNKYDLDYLVITAQSRTQVGAPVVITLNVRDRMGAGASGINNGVTSIQIKINVINSAPRVQHPDAVYTLTTAPVGDSIANIIDTSVGIDIKPSTMIINARGYTAEEDAYRNFLIDNEGDNVMFYTGATVEVVDDKGNTEDASGNRYLGKYLNVSLSSAQLTITALNSTQSISKLYVKFTVTDGRYNGSEPETFRCQIQVEVLNARFTVNNGDDGFTATKFGEGDEETPMNLWTVETLDSTDINKTRYFASSNAAVEKMMSSDKYKVSSDQIKRLTNDTDGLQGVVLSPVDHENNPDATRNYITINRGEGSDPATYKNGVPYINLNNSTGSPVGVYIDLLQSPNGGHNLSDYFAENGVENNIDILYIVDGEIYSAKDLRSPGNTVVQNNVDKFFDEEGRWIVRDWVVSVTPNNSTAIDVYIQLNFMMSDEACYGGGTWYKSTGYDNNNGVAVDGFRFVRYQLGINSLGIVPYTYYDQFDGYYAVRDGADATKNYLPTYDGYDTSIYDYNETYNSFYLDGTGAISTSAGGIELKTRAGGQPDGTDAGIHSGREYGAEGTEYSYDLHYDNGNGQQLIVKGEKAFRYSDTISVSGTKNEITAVPMSYFGLRTGIVEVNPSTGVITYPDNKYVSYAVHDSDGYGRSDMINALPRAITISDGKHEWKGTDGDFALNKNPYVTIGAFDAYIANRLDTSDASYVAARNGKYFNKALSMTTVGSDGLQNGLFVLENNALTPASAANAANLVGNNGHLMYLADQETKLQENMFGLTFAKKNTRSSASSLTVTVTIAECEYVNDKTKVAGEVEDDVTVSFKLEIGNSPIVLQSVNGENGVRADDKGYYTEVELNTSSPTFNIALTRTGVRNTDNNVDRIIRYDDDDKVKLADDTIDDAASDKAYFYSDSMYKLSSWGGGKNYYDRVKTTTSSDGNNPVFDYTSQNADAQRSMRNYFGRRAEGTYAFSPATSVSDQPAYIGNVNSDFEANTGIYGSNMIQSNDPNDMREGFSRFFDVTVSGDGSMLSITPRAKTTLNSGMYKDQDRLPYYNERGLEWDRNKSNGNNKPAGKGYYPLKVLIYDSHGDGFVFGSYVALEIRVYIDGSAPTLSANLQDDLINNEARGDKKIDVSLPVGQSYIYYVKDVVRSDSLLIKENGEIFWESDYNALKDAALAQGVGDRSLTDLFKLDTGTYLMSPFSDRNYGWTKTTNANLRAGTAKLYDTARDDNGVYNEPIERQPDIVMSMEYTGGAVSGNKTVLSNASSPVGNAVTVTVNRRSTFESKQYKNFTFKILFTDSDGNSTRTLSVNISVTNQAPTTRANAVKNAAHLKMRVDDSFTVVTTPYDKFTGKLDGNSVSAEASTSYKTVVNNPSSIFYRNLLKVNGDDGYRTAVRYSDLTAENVDNSDKYKLHSYDENIVAAQHLGYLAIADDDTPWTLRIVDIHYYDSSCFKIAQKYDQLPLEGGSGDMYALDAIIIANKVCTDMPITITVRDEENATVSFTIYVTVESSRPSPITDGDNVHRRHEGLLTTYDNRGREQLGVYEMYMTAFDGTEHLRNVNVNDPEANGGTRTVRDVYGKVTLNVNQIAYDPDYSDNNEIALYSENEDYDIFTFNGMPMSRAENDKFTYYNDLFGITVAKDYKSFTITCYTYNPYEDWDSLKFYVRDVGNNVFSNAAAITIRISTLNSALTNAHQASVGKVTNGIINANTIDTVYVKAYDDYVGVSADVESLPDDEKYNVINVPSTYQMFNYSGVADSIDQPDTAGWGINDSDVVNNRYNLNYDMRVYALMEPIEGNARRFESLSINSASALFFENQSAASSMMQNHYWYMRDERVMSKYLIAGVRAGGGMISGVNNSLNMFLQQYFIYEIGDDGVSLAFRPVTSNIDLNIMFYVEFEKNVTDFRSITRAGASERAGTLFYVKVKDSAPIANDENDEILSFKGKVGDSNVFTIYNEENAFGSLFNDSDAGDMVVVNAFTSNITAEDDYAAALAEADCDWKARAGVPRAIDIEVNNANETVGNIPAHSLKITVRRRIDVKDENGKYLSEVTLPILLAGTDISGRSVTARIFVTVQNSELSFNDDKLADSPTKFDAFGAGYEISYDETEKMYVFDTYVAPDSAELTMNLVLDSWLKDPDFTSMSADIDSFKLAKPLDAVVADKYMGNDGIDVCLDESETVIAKITPIFGNNGQHIDTDHFAGFVISAVSYARGVTGVAYMRILDRSASDRDEGVTIMVKVTVLNAAPNVIVGMDKKQYTITGSDSKESEAFTIDITDFVEDRNNDTVRIFGMAPLPATNVHCSAEEENGGNILRVAAGGDPDAPQICSVTARKGFYGTQSVLITVADGNLATDLSARTVMFTVTFTVVYDFTQVTELNTLNAIRSLPVKVTPEKLLKDVKDTFDETYVSSGNDGNRNILMSADGDKMFNPGGDYVIDSLVANDSIVTVNRDADGDWQFVCSREVEQINFNVTFRRRVDVGNENATVYTRTFSAHVGKNTAPVLIEQIRRNNEFTFHTREGDYGLDNSGTVMLTTSMLFSDIDIASGDSLVFDPAVTSVVSGTMCSVRVSDDGLMLYITFNSRGETDLTVGVKDKTGETVKTTFKIKNIDRPAPSFMDTIKISYESHPYIWLGVALGVLVLIVFIILLVILLKRRKRKQEELEAILVSEMELEEQMMRLAGGTGSPYQSFGYLPPSMPVQNDPGLMIGSGANAPQNDVIGLNPGNNNPGNDDNSDINM